MANRHHDLVAARAGYRCEYCRFPASFSDAKFVCDHIIARKHDGLDVAENLALSCPDCNSHKLDNIAGVDFSPHEPVRLFNPRRDIWMQHFRWSHATLIGLTPIGRATIKVLAINREDRVDTRAGLMKEGLAF
jgi:hypothetical protein